MGVPSTKNTDQVVVAAPTTLREEEAREPDEVDTQSDADSIQPGVQKAILLKKAWTPISLTIAFIGLFLTTFVLILSDYSQGVYEPYVTSEFRQHSAMSAARLVNSIARICAFPIVAKLSDAFGRAEMFIFAFVASTLCFVLFATSHNIGQYFVSGIFDSIGGTAFLSMQQVFVADATNLVNRALWSTLPESITNIPAIYIGTIIGENMLNGIGWRWGYGIWAIVLPIAAIPLVATMLYLQRRARKHGLWTRSLAKDKRQSVPLWKAIFHMIWVELDIMGIFLLIAGLSLMLIPLSLTGSFNPGRWREASFIAMFILGVALLGAMVMWELKFAQKPLLPGELVKDRTAMVGCLMQGLDFMGHAVFSIFFSSYLQVAPGYSPGHAVRIDNSIRLAYQTFAIFVALGMKYTKRSQMWLLMGPPLVLLGQGVLIYIVNHNGGQGNEASFVAARVCIGIGRALFQTAAQVSVQAAVSRKEVAVATGLFQAAVSIGAAFGTSISGAIWRNTLPEKLVAYLPPEDQSNALSIFQSLVVARSFEEGTPIRDAINRSYRESMQLLAIATTAISVPNIILMFFMRDIRLDEEDKKDEAQLDHTVEKFKARGRHDSE